MSDIELEQSTTKKKGQRLTNYTEEIKSRKLWLKVNVIRTTKACQFL